jgi:hypothetical protein
VKTDAVTKIIVGDLVKNKNITESLRQFLEYEAIHQPAHPFTDARPR